MSWREVPIIPSIVVAACVTTMIMLGFWQLGRVEEKEQQISLYATALKNGDLRPFPGENGGVASEADLFHPTGFECTKVNAREAISGRSQTDQSGYAQIARCETVRGPADVKLGWSASPDFPDWNGGVVEGLIAPGGRDGARVQMAEPIEGLQPLAVPDPNDLPNNHLAYAGQWFLFALTALVIYFLAIRSRAKARRESLSESRREGDN
ncbi:MAG: SURF1 family cytochrome oxidase biogenesis protein [Erythrobacter sp.]